MNIQMLDVKIDHASLSLAIMEIDREAIAVFVIAVKTGFARFDVGHLVAVVFVLKHHVTLAIEIADFLLAFRPPYDVVVAVVVVFDVPLEIGQRFENLVINLPTTHLDRCQHLD